jgi:eukaryotic-like serine/threonine-protein kinase
MPLQCPEPDLLEQLLLGRLDEPQIDALAEHLSQCGHCAEAAERVRPMDELIEAARAGANAPEDPERATIDGLVEHLSSLTPAATEPSAADPARELNGVLAPPRDAGEIGRLGPYRVRDVIGAGGMGIVLRAEDEQLRRGVALKVMKPALAADAIQRRRFLREARAVAAIEHDHIVSIHQVGEESGVPFLTMPLLQGESLEERLGRVGHMPVAEVVRIGREIAAGLAAAHERGLTHRDIKPPNIWLEAERDRVKILDFGLAHGGEADERITQFGTLTGTPAYMAPEQVRGEAEPRSDLFSLGCVLYRMCTGTLPFRGKDTLATLAALAQDQPPPPRTLNPAIPAELSALVMKLLAKDPAERYQSACEVASALDAVGRARPEARMRRFGRWVAGVAAAVLLLAVGVWLVPDIIIRIRGKDGSTTEIKVPKGSDVDIEKDGKPFIPPGKVGQIHCFAGHEGGILSVALSPDGRYAASGSWDDNLVRLWDLKIHKELAPFKGHTENVNSVAFSADSRFVLSGSADKTMRLWEVDSRKQVQLFEGHTSPVWSVALSRDGSRALSCGTHDKSVRLWDVKTGNELRNFEGHTLRPCSVAFSSDAKRVLSGGWNQIMLLWDADTGKELQRFTGHTKHIESVAFSPDDRYALSGSRDGTMRLWEVESGQEVRCFKGHRGWVNAVAFLPDGRRAVSAGNDGSMLLWDIEDARKVLRVFDGHVDRVTCVACSRDGRLAITGADLRDKTLRLWQLPAPATAKNP